MTGAASPPDGKAVPKQPAIRPRDAATLIIVDHAAGAPRVLLGKRRMDMKFMPGKYVFPGGRVDRADRVVAAADELDPLEVEKLLLDMKGVPSKSRARALALAAVRETYEEAGLVIGEPPNGRALPREHCMAAVLRDWLCTQVDASDLLCARHHAARPSTPVRHTLLLHGRIRDHPSHRRARGGAVGPRLDDAGGSAHAGSASDHPRRPRGSGRSPQGRGPA